GRFGWKSSNIQVRGGIRTTTHELAVAAYLAGHELPESELVELAARLLCWATVTASYEARWAEARRSGADIGDSVRNAVRAAFADLLPEPLRDFLQVDQLPLTQVLHNLSNQWAVSPGEVDAGQQGDGHHPDSGGADTGGGPVAVDG